MRSLAALVMLTLAILGATFPAWADNSPVDGTYLMNACKDRSAFCWGYVRGAADVWGSTHPGCMDRKVVASQLGDLTYQQLFIHPELRHEWAGKLMPKLFESFFPCPDNNRTSQ